MLHFFLVLKTDHKSKNERLPMLLLCFQPDNNFTDSIVQVVPDNVAGRFVQEIAQNDIKGTLVCLTNTHSSHD